MIYPEFLKEHDTIALIAPSDGITDKIKQQRMKSAIKNMKNKNYNIIESPYLYQSKIGRSTTKEKRAEEIMNALENPNIKMLWCVTGGDFLVECLPLLDFSVIKKNPKWIQGYSDPTGLLFLITTHTNIATIYGYNFGTFGMNPWHDTLTNNVKFLEGAAIIQKSQSRYESEPFSYITGTETFQLREKVEWKVLNSQNNVTLDGRLLGGCLDVLLNIVGTSYDVTKQFIKQYKEGIIWYFDCCELSSEALIRGLWQLKEAGWFSNAKGFIFGRPMVKTSYYHISFEDAVLESLKEFGVPIIVGADLGHVPPVLTFVNGAFAHLYINDEEATMELELC